MDKGYNCINLLLTKLIALALKLLVLLVLNGLKVLVYISIV